MRQSGTFSRVTVTVEIETNGLNSYGIEHTNLVGVFDWSAKEATKKLEEALAQLKWRIVGKPVVEVVIARELP